MASGPLGGINCKIFFQRLFTRLIPRPAAFKCDITVVRQTQHRQSSQCRCCSELFCYILLDVYPQGRLSFCRRKYRVISQVSHLSLLLILFYFTENVFKATRRRSVSWFERAPRKHSTKPTFRMSRARLKGRPSRF